MLFLVLAVVGARADYGAVEKINRNLFMSASISLGWPHGPATGPLTKVSGTNVNISFSGFGNSGAPYEGNDPWVAVAIIKIEAKVANSDVHTWLFPGSPGTAGAGLVRFASTHFGDGASISLWTKATFNLYPTGGGTPTENTVESTITLSCYNKLQAWSTHEDVINNQYQYSANPPTNYYSATSHRCIEKSRIYFPIAELNHQQIFPAAHADDNQQHESTDPASINNRMDEATAWFIATHGEPTNIRASFDDSSVISPDDVLSFGEISGYTERAVGIPPPNLAVVYARSTLSNPIGFGNAFKMLYFLSPLADRAYLGFPRILWSILNFPSGAIGGLDVHANLLAAELSTWWTVQEALDYANNRYIPRDDQGAPMPMQVVGDPFARLTGVYMSATEWDNARRYDWIWFKD